MDISLLNMYVYNFLMALVYYIGVWFSDKLTVFLMYQYLFATFDDYTGLEVMQ